jgi:hypothetical protein
MGVKRPPFEDMADTGKTRIRGEVRVPVEHRQAWLINGEAVLAGRTESGDTYVRLLGATKRPVLGGATTS